MGLQVETYIDFKDIREVGALAAKIEQLGYDRLLIAETSHDSFIAATLCGLATKRAHLETSVAIAFPRSPMITAYAARDAQALCGGRFVLGLGTQVKAHNERRFSVPWSPPGPRLREYVLALRAIFDCFDRGTPLNFAGTHYQFTLMTPFFSPGPSPYGRIPIHIAAVNPRNIELAGEVADGLRVHPFHSIRYLDEVIWPALRTGLATAYSGLHVVTFPGS